MIKEINSTNKYEPILLIDMSLFNENEFKVICDLWEKSERSPDIFKSLIDPKLFNKLEIIEYGNT